MNFTRVSTRTGRFALASGTGLAVVLVLRAAVATAGPVLPSIPTQVSCASATVAENYHPCTGHFAGSTIQVNQGDPVIWRATLRHTGLAVVKVPSTHRWGLMLRTCVKNAPGID